MDGFDAPNTSQYLIVNTIFHDFPNCNGIKLPQKIVPHFQTDLYFWGMRVAGKKYIKRELLDIFEVLKITWKFIQCYTNCSCILKGSHEGLGMTNSGGSCVEFWSAVCIFDPFFGDLSMWVLYHHADSKWLGLSLSFDPFQHHGFQGHHLGIHLGGSTQKTNSIKEDFLLIIGFTLEKNKQSYRNWPISNR